MEFIGLSIRGGRIIGLEITDKYWLKEFDKSPQQKEVNRYIFKNKKADTDKNRKE